MRRKLPVFCGDHIILSQDDILNSIPDFDRPEPPKPTIDDTILVKNNEVLRRAPNHDVSETSNVLMSHAGDDSLFSNKEVLAGKAVQVNSGTSLALLS